MISKISPLLGRKFLFFISILCVATAHATIDLNPKKDSDYLEFKELPGQIADPAKGERGRTEIHMKQAESNRQMFFNGKWVPSQKAHWVKELDKYYSNYSGGENNIPVSTTNVYNFNRNNDDCGQIPSLCRYKFVIPYGPTGGFGLGGAGTSLVALPKTEIVNIKTYSYDQSFHTVAISLGKVSAPDKEALKQKIADFKKYNTTIFGVGSKNPIKALDISGIGSTAQLAERAVLDKVKDNCKAAGIVCDDNKAREILSHNCGEKLTVKEENTKSEKKTQEVVRVKNKTRILTKVEPMVYANVDFSEKILSMTVFDPTIGGKVKNGGKNPGLIPLQPANKKDGYKVIKTRMGAGGAGPSVQTVIQWAGSPLLAAIGRFGGYAGVMGTLSMSDALVRRVNTLEEADKNNSRYRGAVNVFETDEGLDKTINNIINHWKVDESYNFQYSGGYIVSAGTSVMLIAMGPTYFYDKTRLNKTVTKIGDKRIMVETKDVKLESFALTVGLGLVSASHLTSFDSVPLFGEHLNTRTEMERSTFLFDLESPVGRKAFKNFMMGNALDAQYLAAKGEDPSVLKVDLEKTKSYQGRDYYGEKETMNSFYFGIPFIYANKLKGVQTQEGASDFFVDGRHNDFNQGIYMDRYDRRIIFDHKMKLKGFYGGAQTTSDFTTVPSADGSLRSNKNVEHYYYGRYAWNFQDESASKSEFIEQLTQLTNVDTGLVELNMDASRLPEDLGYVNIELTLDLSKRATEVLIDKLVDSDGQNFEAAVRSEIDKYFLAYGNGRKGSPTGIKSADYCSMHEGFTTNGSKDAVAQTNWDYSIQRCRNFAFNESFNSGVTSKMVQLMEEIQKLLPKATDQSGRNTLSKAYREFGILMMKNQFVFKAIYNILKDAEIGDFVTLRIQGQEIASMVRHMPSDVYEVKPDISMK